MDKTFLLEEIKERPLLQKEEKNFNNRFFGRAVFEKPASKKQSTFQKILFKSCVVNYEGSLSTIYCVD